MSMILYYHVLKVFKYWCREYEPIKIGEKKSGIPKVYKIL